MNTYNLNKYSSDIFLDEFKSKDLEFLPPHEGGTELYDLKTGKFLRIEKRGNRPSREELDLQKKQGISRRASSGPCPGYVWCKIGPKNHQFTVRLPSTNGDVNRQQLVRITEAVADIVQLDNLSREIHGPETELNLRPKLFRVELETEVDTKEVFLQYSSTRVNTEWGMGFKKNTNNKWEYTQTG